MQSLFEKLHKRGVATIKVCFYKHETSSPVRNPCWTVVSKQNLQILNLIFRRVRSKPY